MCQQLVSEMELINILIMIITFNISLYFPRLFPSLSVPEIRKLLSMYQLRYISGHEWQELIWVCLRKVQLGSLHDETKSPDYWIRYPHFRLL